MAFAPKVALWVGLAAGATCVVCPCAFAGPRAAGFAPAATSSTSAAEARTLPPTLPHRGRAAVDRVISHPTVTSRGPWQTFRGDRALYEWLLDHPARGVAMWRRLGAQCLDIRELGGNRFAWSDGEGSDIRWQTVLATDSVRVWYAEGNVKAATFLPAFAVRAVVLLRYGVEPTRQGCAVIHHQAELYFQTDSKAAAAVTRLLGESAPRLAEQCVVQLETFFSALVWYAHTHPGPARRATPGAAPGPGPVRPFVLPPGRDEP